MVHTVISETLCSGTNGEIKEGRKFKSSNSSAPDVTVSSTSPVINLQHNEIASGKSHTSSSNDRIGNLHDPWPPYLKLDFPRINGDELEAWLVKAEYYFQVTGTPLENRVKIATLYLDEKAVQRHQGYVKMKGAGAYVDWEGYRQGLRARFGAQIFNDPLVDLKNLKQSGLLQEYLDAFDLLYSKAGIKEDQALSFFLSRPVDELQIPARMFKPQSLFEAFSLTR
ncbi:hypothetical protein GH714_006985 [Hevea brasiliensis]|uniref:Retrotransposon gag domain-containing protein n=1 Tax=Hevea brasiliensis TaxID=3981 RepID=A0A6A6KVT5_HEVBR|nr:hypothetical protein GH714_006985 [Hevea brasiliensis]